MQFSSSTHTHTHTHTRKCAYTMKLSSLSYTIRKIWGKFDVEWTQSNALINVITSETYSAFCKKIASKTFYF